ncbi:sulfate permease [Evansella sp. AB-P1]|uniref:SulP family inorganic anion transporter n=1 Tax=Evansella sp. AB-P1 TaxID=3037653 RepID=UPI00241C4F08|nr:sulfate permease [Evansella sp. AB-P1]MDG5786083.1 sulfate permease [Evansella sp. AB-P1]
MKYLFPFLDWMGKYSVERNLKGDLYAGTIVAIMLIPQGMAYAMLAGLPPVFGLYASTFPLIIYALYGSSRHLSVGPVAIVSLLVYTGISGLAEPGTQEYIAYVLLLTLMVGVLQILLGVLKLGSVTKYISHGVISGFTSAAAIIIGFSQLKYLLGIPLEASGNVFLISGEIGKRLDEINYMTFFIGVLAILFLILIKVKIPKIPGPLVVVVLSIVVIWFYQLDTLGINIVGTIPSGLPLFSFPKVTLELLIELIPAAITITIIGFIESYAIGKVIADKEGYSLHANRELNGLGLANVTASFFSGYPITGGFSRSAVNHQSGAKSGLASIVTAILIILMLLFFTSILYYLPKAVLSAIILVAVYGLINVKGFMNLWNTKRVDGITFLLTFLVTLIISVEWGIAIGIIFSLLVILYQKRYG